MAYQPQPQPENQPPPGYYPGYATAPGQPYATAPGQPYATAPAQPYAPAPGQAYAPAPGQAYAPATHSSHHSNVVVVTQPSQPQVSPEVLEPEGKSKGKGIPFYLQVLWLVSQGRRSKENILPV